MINERVTETLHNAIREIGPVSFKAIVRLFTSKSGIHKLCSYNYLTCLGSAYRYLNHALLFDDLVLRYHSVWSSGKFTLKFWTAKWNYKSYYNARLTYIPYIIPYILHFHNRIIKVGYNNKSSYNYHIT